MGPETTAAHKCETLSLGTSLSLGWASMVPGIVCALARPGRPWRLLADSAQVNFDGDGGVDDFDDVNNIGV